MSLSQRIGLIDLHLLLLLSLLLETTGVLTGGHFRFPLLITICRPKHSLIRD